MLLLVTVVFQALLGMWTVTLLLSPLIVTAHLLGGFTTLSLLWWLWLNNRASSVSSRASVPITHKPGVDYEFGILESPVRTAIYFTDC